MRHNGEPLHSGHLHSLRLLVGAHQITWKDLCGAGVMGGEGGRKDLTQEIRQESRV